MKKLICIAMGLLLMLSLISCGNSAASTQLSAGSASIGSAPGDERDDSAQISTEDNSAETDHSVCQDVVAVTFMGLADNHTVEVQLKDGGYLSLQFDSAQYGDVLSSHAEGDQFMALLESETLDGGATSWKLAGYYGQDYRGVILLDTSVTDQYDMEMLGSITPAQTFVLYIDEDLRDVRLYTLTYQDDGSLKKDELWLGQKALYTGQYVKFNLDVEEYYPNWLLEYTLHDGTQIQYFIGMAEEPLYLPVCLSPAGSRLVEE